ncbi:ATP-grasp domain-containing protein [uncultured Desulfuromonas sp.]|uniref:ATP-grasp domain-containing protein n=1 Tax=uncultured Desulfuromonas sp. TaxID=181013 RepID=UPI002AAA964E|nr:ATP-grasp domain-containing protein [uncultured Desulfuromonas sp.]
MILLDRPYVSSFLLQSLQQHHIAAIDTPELQQLQLPQQPDTISTAEASKRFSSDPSSRLLCNSENAIGWISDHLSNTPLPEKIRLFKDKCAFRDLLKDAFPDFFYAEIPAEQLAQTDTSAWSWPVIVKPAVGFFSMAVHRVENAEQWPAIVEKIHRGIDVFRTEYPQQVLDASRFIVEHCIEGEEYAIDAYYNDVGEPVILNVLHHRFTGGNDVSDRVYTTSAEMVFQLHDSLNELLSVIGKAADLVNFPVHLEVRITAEGQVVPIELNPMRFAGWCTTDIAYHAHGINPYFYYFDNQKPDWEQIAALSGDRLTSFVILDRPADVPVEKITGFDYVAILEELEQPVELRKVNYRNYPVFGIVFAHTLPDEQEELDLLLRADMHDFIELA